MPECSETSEITVNQTLVQDPALVQAGSSTVRSLWIHRRRMAYIALFASIVIVIVVILTALFAPEHSVLNLSKFEAFLISAFMTLITLVGAYMGLATVADVKAGGSRFK